MRADRVPWGALAFVIGFAGAANVTYAAEPSLPCEEAKKAYLVAVEATLNTPEAREAEKAHRAATEATNLNDPAAAEAWEEFNKMAARVIENAPTLKIAREALEANCS